MIGEVVQHATEYRGRASLPPSYDVIREACEELGIKAVARILGVSTALVYKWCEPPETSAEREASGALNPLDRVRALYEATRDIRLVRYVTNAAGGFFMANPSPPPNAGARWCAVMETQAIVRKFSELLDAVTQSVETPGITEDEARQIREEWEDLKAWVERFTVACERGYLREQNPV